ncbi:aminotransferase class I/II-fold pyridoxal phosphate-dependent enzyme [Paenibacillus kandeliae]|uniref:aminotransferase class I/II-fold pyridoxal phosphate-dependent enzyme n=1 Tax=Paenibacillus kandeliae TaxID=3231269 RepID=UPI00345AF1F9
MKTDFNLNLLELPQEQWAQEQLAIEGGRAVLGQAGRKTIFPNITKEDVLQMLISIQKQPSDVVSEFTEQYRQYVGANYAISTASGTSSLHLALIGAGVQPGDEVILPAFTFIATAQAVVAAKAVPIFADVDPDTYCLHVNDIERLITPRTKVIMPVHVHGLPANIPAIQQLCDQYQLKLVEDASHAHSASIDGQLCGSLGDTAGQSLMADKNFPVGGEGGIAFFKTEEAYVRAQQFLENSGIDYDISWIAAAFGISQLQRLPYYDAVRQRNAHHLIDTLNATTLFQGPYIPEGYTHSFNMFRLRLNVDLPQFAGIPPYQVKEAIQTILMEEGVFAREWQNVPIPGHLPFINRKGFGNQYPFSLYEGGELPYGLEHFPNTLHMLNTTLAICRELRSPVEYEKLLTYELAFKKLDQHIDQIAEYARSLNSQPPYERDARLG